MEKRPEGEPVDLQRIRRLDPFRRRADRAPGGFKTVRLNAAGWAALVGAGLALGVVIAVAGAPHAMSLPAGILIVWHTAHIVDYGRWRRSSTIICREWLDPAVAAEIIRRLAEKRIGATYREHVDDDGEVDRCIRCRNPDRDAVAALLDDLDRRRV